jgi:hypothetical protein
MGGIAAQRKILLWNLDLLNEGGKGPPVSELPCEDEGLVH